MFIYEGSKHHQLVTETSKNRKIIRIPQHQCKLLYTAIYSIYSKAHFSSASQFFYSRAFDQHKYRSRAVFLRLPS